MLDQPQLHSVNGRANAQSTMLNVGYARPAIPGKRSPNDHTGTVLAAAQSPSASTPSSADSRRRLRKPPTPPPLSPTQRRLAPAAATGKQRDQQQSHHKHHHSSQNQEQQTNLEKFEHRQRQRREKREEVTWETSSYDRERGRMVRSLNVVERNRLLETQRQLSREMEQRIRDIRQEQTAVLMVRSAAGQRGSSNDINRRAWSHQDLVSLLLSSGSSRTHSGGTSRVR